MLLCKVALGQDWFVYRGVNMLHLRNLISKLCILAAILFSSSVRADTLIVTLSVTPQDSDYVYQHLAKPAGFPEPSHGYHVTLGFVEDVPHGSVGQVSNQLTTYLTAAYDVSNQPIRFQVGKATTWGLEHKNVTYNPNTTILLPQDSSLFNYLNGKVAEFAQAGASIGMKMDQNTQPANYLAHITLGQSQYGPYAVNDVNQLLLPQGVHAYLNRYHISVQAQTSNSE